MSISFSLDIMFLSFIHFCSLVTAFFANNIPLYEYTTFLFIYMIDEYLGCSTFGFQMILTYNYTNFVWTCSDFFKVYSIPLKALNHKIFPHLSSIISPDITLIMMK